MLLFGLLFVAGGIIILFSEYSKSKFSKDAFNGDLKGYRETYGKVICNAFEYENRRYDTEVGGYSTKFAVITPIVEYEVNGKKYEAQNQTLRPNGEVPEGTTIRVWYKEDNPSNSILETEMAVYQYHKPSWIPGISAIAVGGLIIYLYLKNCVFM